MSTFVLIHGAGDVAWSWHLLAAELEARHHDVVAVDLPCDDDRAGLAEYADTVVDAIGDRRDLVVVGHSLGAFTAPLVCARVAADRLVLLAPMIPAPGEPFNDWWANTGVRPGRPRRGRDGDVLPRRPAAPGRGGDAPRARSVRDPARHAVAPRGVAGGPDERPDLPRRPRVSPRPSAAGSHRSGWVSPPTRSTAGTASRSAAPARSPINCTPTPPSDHRRRPP